MAASPPAVCRCSSDVDEPARRSTPAAPVTPRCCRPRRCRPRRCQPRRPPLRACCRCRSRRRVEPVLRPPPACNIADDALPPAPQVELGETVGGVGPVVSDGEQVRKRSRQLRRRAVGGQLRPAAARADRRRPRDRPIRISSATVLPSSAAAPRHRPARPAPSAPRRPRARRLPPHPCCRHHLARGVAMRQCRSGAETMSRPRSVGHAHARRSCARGSEGRRLPSQKGAAASEARGGARTWQCAPANRCGGGRRGWRVGGAGWAVAAAPARPAGRAPLLRRLDDSGAHDGRGQDGLASAG